MNDPTDLRGRPVVRQVQLFVTPGDPGDSIAAAGRAWDYSAEELRLGVTKENHD